MNEPWMKFASCRDTSEPQLWDVEYDATVSAEPAKAVCRMCPVKSQCLEHAIAEHEKWMVWGGMTAKERGEEVRRRRQRARVA